MEGQPDTVAADRPTEVQLAATEPSTPGSDGKVGAQEIAEAGSSAADAAAKERPSAKADCWSPHSPSRSYLTIFEKSTSGSSCESSSS